MGIGGRGDTREDVESRMYPRFFWLLNLNEEEVLLRKSRGGRTQLRMRIGVQIITWMLRCLNCFCDRQIERLIRWLDIQVYSAKEMFGLENFTRHVL